jgi:transmembrane sensor
VSVNRQIAEEAAEWVLRLDEEPLTRRERKALMAWLSRSPDHVQEFLCASTLVQAISDLPQEETEVLRALLGEKADGVVTAIELDRHRTPSPALVRTSLVQRLAPIAAATVLFGAAITGLGLFLLRSDAPETVSFVTAIGEQRTLPLEDGSIIYLNTDSDVQVRMMKDERQIMLIRGEAMFDVAKDASRPFRVTAGDHQVEAVGTEFNVYRSRNGLEVVVVEGVVEVAPTRRIMKAANGAEEVQRAVRLKAGEKVSFDGKAAVPTPVSANIDRETSWRTRKFAFQRTRLDDIVSEYNRYSKRKLVIKDDGLGSLRFTGSFDVDDPQGLIVFLQATIGVETDRSDPGRILLYDANRR